MPFKPRYLRVIISCNSRNHCTDISPLVVLKRIFIRICERGFRNKNVIVHLMFMPSSPTRDFHGMLFLIYNSIPESDYFQVCM